MSTPRPRELKIVPPTNYTPSGLARPSAGELRNKWDAQSLTDFLRRSCGTEYEFRAELLRRAQDHLRQCTEAVEKFRKFEDLTDSDAKKDLLALERARDEAAADAQFAALDLKRLPL